MARSERTTARSSRRYQLGLTGPSASPSPGRHQRKTPPRLPPPPGTPSADEGPRAAAPPLRRHVTAGPGPPRHSRERSWLGHHCREPRGRRRLQQRPTTRTAEAFAAFHAAVAPSEDHLWSRRPRDPPRRPAGRPAAELPLVLRRPARSPACRHAERELIDSDRPLPLPDGRLGPLRGRGNPTPTGGPGPSSAGRAFLASSVLNTSGALMNTNTPALAVHGLARMYGDGAGAVHALAGVDLAFPPGTFTAVMGPSGSGKSTFLTCAAGLERPDRGRVAHRRPGRHRLGRGRPHPAAPRAHRLRLPGLPPDALPDRRAERRAPAAPGRPPPGPAAGPRRCSTGSASTTAAGTSRPRCPAASSSGSRSPGRWSPTPPSCSPTSRPARSTPPPRARCSRLLRACVDDAGPDGRDGHPRPGRRVVRRPVVFLVDGRVAGRMDRPDRRRRRRPDGPPRRARRGGASS